MLELNYARRLVQVPRVSKLAVLALIVGLGSGPAAVGLAVLVQYLKFEHHAPRILGVLSVFPGAVGLVAAVVAVARIVPGFSRLRGLWMAAVGLVFAVLALVVGVGLATELIR